MKANFPTKFSYLFSHHFSPRWEHFWIFAVGKKRHVEKNWVIVRIRSGIGEKGEGGHTTTGKNNFFFSIILLNYRADFLKVPFKCSFKPQIYHEYR